VRKTSEDCLAVMFGNVCFLVYIIIPFPLNKTVSSKRTTVHDVPGLGTGM